MGVSKLINLGIQYIRFLTSVFGKSYNNHFPLFINQTWLTPDTQSTFKVTEMSLILILI